jgi:hypothetical protein
VNQTSLVVRLRRDHWPPVVGTLVLILIWAKFPHFFIASDEYYYAARAYGVLESGLRSEFGGHIFGHRVGVYLPVAAVYAVVGASPHTTNLVLLAAAVTILWVVCTSLPDVRARWFGTLFVVTCVPLLIGTTELLPDLLLAAYLALAAAVLNGRAARSSSRSLCRGGVLAAAFWFLALMTKENAYWLAPVWLGAVCLDLKRRNFAAVRFFHVPALITFSLLLVAYLVVCQIWLGDALARLSAVQALTGHHHWSIESSEELVRRLTVDPARFFWDYYGLLCVLPLFSYWFVPPGLRLWVGVAGSYLVLFWFGSTSLTSYQPLPLRQRMPLPLVPAFSILSACLAARLPIPPLSIPRLPIPRLQGVLRDLLITAALAFWFVPRMKGYVESWSESDELAAMSDLRKTVQSQPQKRFLLVTADERAVHFLRVYFGFRYPENLETAYSGALDHEHLARAQQAYLVVHRRRLRGSRQRDRIEALKLPKAYKSRQIKVYGPSTPSELEPLVRRPRRARG